jgi:methyl-accepting chemotaxis protein
MFKNMKLGVRLGLGFGILVVLLVTVGMIALDRIGKIDQKVQLVVENRMPKTKAANEWIDAVNSVARILRNGVISNDPKFVAKEFDRIAGEREKIDKAFKMLEETILSKEGKEALAAAANLRMPVRESQERIIEYAKANNDSAAANLLFGEYRELQGKYLKALAGLCDFQENLALNDGKEAAVLGDSTRILVIILLAFSALLAISIAWFVTRSITKPIGECIEIAEKVAQGQIDVEVHANTTDETGILKSAMARMIDAIRSMSGDATMLSKAAVEGKLSTRADATKHQGEFRQIVQGVNNTLDAVIGPLNVAAKYVDDISKGNIPAKITDTYNGDFNTLKNNLNRCIDAVNALVSDAAVLSKAAVEGKLATRADASKHEGDFRKIVSGVNDTLDAVIGPLNVAAKYVDDISKGNIPAKITDTYNGDFNTLKNNLNTCVEAVNALVADAGMLVQAAVEGRLQTRADASKHQGDFRKIVSGVNDTLDAVIGPVNEAAQVLEKVAARDLTARMLGNYAGDLAKIKDSMNLAVENLESALSQVGEATEQVAGASGQISSGSQSLAQGANEQAGSLEEVSASLEEMASMTRQSADNANAAKLLAGEANEHASTGTDAMARMSTAIVKIKDSSDQTAKIVKTIDEIAMQTNLLALNAAVEAARAGEAGRGFAVVAEEVRNLAQRSAQAAKNTADMIAESVKNAEAGVKISQEVSVSFDKISTSARKVNDLIGEIASASKEQAQGIKEVGTAVSQMDKVTQQNAANAEESASASEELSSQAEELQAMVGQFKIARSAKAASTSQKSDKFRQLMDHSKRVSLDDRSTRKIRHDAPVAMDAERLAEF